MDVEERYRLVSRNAEEIVTEEELKQLLATKESPRAYIGFEPSGLVHLGWALVASKIRDLVDAGFDVIIFMADWHAYINDKLGGDIERIRLCANYMQDAFESLGVPRDKVTYVLASQIMDTTEYWGMLMKVGKVTSLSRVKRAMTIMGRKRTTPSWTRPSPLPPHAGHRHLPPGHRPGLRRPGPAPAHMLAREAAEKLHWKVPVALHTRCCQGCRAATAWTHRQQEVSRATGQRESSSTIRREDIARKIKKGFCPPEVEGNPSWRWPASSCSPAMSQMVIERPEKFGAA